MPVTHTIIDEESIAEILSMKEMQFLDFKDKRTKISKLSHDVSGFANADGGEVYLGFSEVDGGVVWDGVSAPEDFDGVIAELTGLFNDASEIQFETLQWRPEGSDVSYSLKITVVRSRSVIRSTAGDVFVRQGTANRKLNRDQIRALELSKGVSSYEDNFIEYGSGDILISAEWKRFSQGNSILDPVRWLRKNGLLSRQAGDDRVTLAAIVLFDDEPQAPLAKHAGLKISRYRTSDSAKRESLGGHPESIDGPVAVQVEKAVKKVSELIERETAVGRVFERIKYPPEAIHEIITNAVIHRDYSVPDDIQVMVFDNRIEVESPGRLPGNITIQNILDSRFSRNPRIVRLVNKFPNPPNKDIGEGLNTAFDAMRNLQLVDPEIEELSGSVKVTLKHEKLSSPDRLAIEFLLENESIRNKDLRDLTGEGSENRVKNMLARLVRQGVIERIPELKGNKAAYRRGAKFDAAVKSIEGE